MKSAIISKRDISLIIIEAVLEISKPYLKKFADKAWENFKILLQKRRKK